MEFLISYWTNFKAQNFTILSGEKCNKRDPLENCDVQWFRILSIDTSFVKDVFQRLLFFIIGGGFNFYTTSNIYFTLVKNQIDRYLFQCVSRNVKVKVKSSKPHSWRGEALRNVTLPVLFISGSCIVIKINLNFYFTLLY